MSAVFEYSGLIWEGLLTTVLVTVLGILVTIVVAFLAGLARLSRFWILRAPAYVFIEFFRGTLMIVHWFWYLYVLSLFYVFVAVHVYVVLLYCCITCDDW